MLNWSQLVIYIFMEYSRQSLKVMEVTLFIYFCYDLKSSIRNPIKIQETKIHLLLLWIIFAQIVFFSNVSIWNNIATIWEDDYPNQLQQKIDSLRIVYAIYIVVILFYTLRVLFAFYKGVVRRRGLNNSVKQDILTKYVLFIILKLLIYLPKLMIGFEVISGVIEGLEMAKIMQYLQ